MKTHKSDYDFIASRQTIVQDFDSFYNEYVYCVIASGFKGLVAAKIASKLVECKGDENKCLQIFKNQKKVQAICKTYQLLNSNYSEYVSQWTRPEDLTELPFIGSITCYHLARNIGLQSCVKPDLHIVRLVNTLFGESGSNEQKAIQTIEELARIVGKQPGLVDFCLWVYKSHDDGKEKECCNKLRLR